jgi:hypothetical protein
MDHLINKKEYDYERILDNQIIALSKELQQSKDVFLQAIAYETEQKHSNISEMYVESIKVRRCREVVDGMRMKLSQKVDERNMFHE